MNKLTIILLFSVLIISISYSLFFVATILNPSLINTNYFVYYSYTYWTIPLLGGAAGFFVANRWGGIKSLTGKAVFYLSLGLFFQSIGQILYAYFSVIMGIEDPYPSPAEIFFVLSILSYIIGTYYLSSISGLASNIKSLNFKIIAGIIAIGMMSFAYYQFVISHDAESSEIILLFLEIMYPFGQSIYVSITLLAFLLNKNLRGGSMMNKIFLLLVGLLSQFFADTFYDRAPVQYSDMLYVYSYTMISVGLILFNDIGLAKKFSSIEVVNKDENAS